MLLFQGHCCCELKLQPHCTKIYPIPLILAPLLWGEYCPSATFPQVLSLFGFPPVPNPILESQLSQTFCSLPRKPILALEWSLELLTALNPSLLQFVCKEACEPISDFHVSRPRKVGRYFPSAIRVCKEFACLAITAKLICWLIFIPRQILEKDVFSMMKA